MEDILSKVNRVFQVVFADESLTVTEETCAEDIEGWDSLQHINILAMLEREFQIEFDIDQIVSLENVGDMVIVIEEMKKAGL